MNFVQIFGASNEFYLVGWGDRLRIEEGGRSVKAPSPFVTPNQEQLGVKIPRMRIPNIRRAGADMNHYSVLLDSVVDMDELREPSLDELDIVESTHKLVGLMEAAYTGRKEMRNMDDYRQYLNVMSELAEVI